MGRRFPFIIVASVAWAAAHVASVPAAMTPAPPAQTPSPSPTEGFHGARCGNGVTEGKGVFEQCDDGNLFGGDGCDPFCTPEIEFTETFVAFEKILHLPPSEFGPSAPFVWLRGRVTVANGQNAFVTVRTFEVAPVGLAQQGTLCIRGFVPPDQPLGPGNVGSAGLSQAGGPFTILTATLHLQQWLNRFPGDQSGSDRVACTEDDPGFQYATVDERQIRLYLRVRSLCDGDGNGDGQVTIDEIVDAVNNGLNGCPPATP